MGQNNRLKYGNLLKYFIAALLLTIPIQLSAQSNTDNKADDKIDPFTQALVGAYLTNSQLKSSLQAKFATDEQVSQALSNYKPTVQLQGVTGVSQLENQSVVSTDPNPPARVRQKTKTEPTNGQVTLKQNLFNASNGSQLDSAENEVKVSEYKFIQTEQDTIAAAATAYAEVIYRKKAIELNESNVKFLANQVKATNVQSDVGEKTLTDVAKAEAEMAEAEAKLSAANGEYIKSIAAYEAIIGSKPGLLAPPKKLKHLPESLDALVNIARENDPAVLAALYAEQQAKNDVDTQFAGFMPSLDANGTLSRQLRAVNRSDRTNQAQALLTLTMPIDTSGAVSAKTRQKTQTAVQRRFDLEQARKKAAQEATKAWSGMKTARNQIIQYEAAIKFGIKSRDGAVLGSEVGESSLLDVLEAQQKLFESQVNLEKSKRELIEAEYKILSSMSACTAASLDLPVERYNLQENYEHAKYKLFGTSLTD